MITQTRQVGDARITRIIEYTAPTHPTRFLLPDLNDAQLQANVSWLAPHHYVPAMDKFIITIQFWVVQHGANVIVVDAGVGNLKHRPAPRTHMLNNLILPWMEAIGAAPETVTHVAMTHLHADHIGWNTVWDGQNWIPTFPNARYLFPRDDYDFFRGEFERKSGVAIGFDDSVVPVVASGRAEMIGPGDVIADTLVAEAAYGHSPGQLTYRLRSKGDEAVFSADIFHSPLQIACPELNTAFCILPDEARLTRAAFLERAAESGSLILPTHFGYPYWGYVRRKAGGGYAFEGAV